MPRFSKPLILAFLVVYVLIVLPAAAAAIVISIRTSGQASDRQEAQRFQVCLQRAGGVEKQNSVARALRADLKGDRALYRSLARTLPAGDLRVLFFDESNKKLKLRGTVRAQRVPICVLLYPKGARLASKYPDAAPTAPPTRTEPR